MYIWFILISNSLDTDKYGVWIYKYTLGLFYCLSLLLLIYFTIQSTRKDPTDWNVLEEMKLWLTQNWRGEEGQKDKSHKFNYFCAACDSYVGDRTKHCWECNRCTELFDHHCGWLNNCIGAWNYWDFVGLIISVLFNTCLMSIQSVIEIILLLTNQYKTLGIPLIPIPIVFLSIGIVINFCV